MYRVRACACGCLPHFVKLSMVEIYNESIYDLLSEEVGIGVKQRLLSTSIEGIGLSTLPVSSREELDAYIATGTTHRAEAATLVHAHSSRSHWYVVASYYICSQQ